MEDDCVCEYDSTWDTESDGDDPAGESQSQSQSQSQSRRSSQDKNKSARKPRTRPYPWHHTSRNMRAAKDMQNYRRGYPNLTDDECSEDKMNNLQFYLNKFPSSPDDIYIESFLKDWRNDYKRLERVHSYIQWLFPLREPGVNYMASELTKKEIEAFKKSEEAKRRLVESYELMLGFYGIRLVNKDTGEVKRAENWKERFGNLERNMHNNLRITRILKSLGELGFEHYQAPLVRFFLEETLVKKNLGSVKRSVLDYFLFAVLDKQNRQELVRFAFLNFEPKDKFLWCPRKIQKQLRKAEKRSDGNGDGKDEASPRGKGRDGEAAVAPQKEDGSDDVTKAQKETDKTSGKEETAPSEASAEPETVANGNADVELHSEVMGNGTDSADDDDDMDQSSGPDAAAAAAATREDAERKPTDNSEDASQEVDNRMQTDTDVDTDTEKPPKKKREEENEAPPLPSNGSVVGGESGADKSADQASAAAAAQTPLKTSKHSPTLSSGREEKIPRTDFNQVPDKTEENEEEQEEDDDEDMSQENVAATNGSVASADRPADD